MSPCWIKCLSWMKPSWAWRDRMIPLRGKIRNQPPRSIHSQSKSRNKLPPLWLRQTSTIASSPRVPLTKQIGQSHWTRRLTQSSRWLSSNRNIWQEPPSHVIPSTWVSRSRALSKINWVSITRNSTVQRWRCRSSTPLTMTSSSTRLWTAPWTWRGLR